MDSPPTDNVAPVDDADTDMEVGGKVSDCPVADPPGKEPDPLLLQAAAPTINTIKASLKAGPGD